jgi:H/ACA ribonucleoprotein complex subunit 4
MFTLKGEAVALAQAALSSSEMRSAERGIVAKTERVIMEPGTYPKAWKLAEKKPGSMQAPISGNKC